MDKNQFWDLIEKAKRICGLNLEASASWLEDQLLQIAPEDILKFHCFVRSYCGASDKYGLWTAAGIMLSGCSDDRFFYFRMWLIAQGKEVYLNTLKDPNFLSKVTPYEYCEFESLGYITSSAYEKLTGKDLYKENMDEIQKVCHEQIVQDVVYHPMIEYPLELPEAVIVYPDLCKRYLSEQRKRVQWTSRTWNTSIPEIQRLWRKGKAEVKKLKELSK